MIVEASVKQSKKQYNKTYTLQEYFDLELKSIHKNEFSNGKIIPMAGGTYNHGMLSGTIHALLFMLFFNTDEITILSNDQKIYITEHDRVVYPDLSAVVGEKELYNIQSITNPTFIVEVTSESTGQYDRRGKFQLYQSLPSFKEYVLVDQNMPIVEVFNKIADNEWKMTAYIGLDKTVKFETLGVSLAMTDIYKKIADLKDPQGIIDFPNI